MGIKDSKHKQEYADMHLELPKQEFTAGEVVTGIVHLWVHKKYPARTVCLEIKGKEKTKWRSHQGSGKKRHLSNHTGENVILISRSIILAFPRGEALPGQYSFPFTFSIPAQMPSSLVYFGPKHSKFTIKYKLTARMEESIDSSQSTMKPVIAKCRIIIRKPC
jgi:hypothetical protein